MRARMLRALVLMLVLAAGASRAEPQPASQRPSDADIAQAVDRVKADPNLATERTIKTLRWKSSNARTVDPHIPDWLQWIIGLFRWVDQSARLLVRVAVCGLVVMLGAYIVRLVNARGARRTAAGFVAPTHVRDLDIRPESLPTDIGGSARALWDRGDHRAALSLLYRGLLSRLVHVHQVPIRDSSTEGDCLSMAADHLAPRKQDYAVLLVHVWQSLVYGGEHVEAATIYALCHDFAPALDRASSVSV
jgi:hypothetical protein